MTTDAARTLPVRWHDPSSRRRAEHLRAYLDSKRGGLVLLSMHGSVLESAEGLLQRLPAICARLAGFSPAAILKSKPSFS